jgi:hypothetical protein
LQFTCLYKPLLIFLFTKAKEGLEVWLKEVEHLPSKHDTLNSNSTIIPPPKKERKEKETKEIRKDVMLARMCE